MQLLLAEAVVANLLDSILDLVADLALWRKHVRTRVIADEQ